MATPHDKFFKEMFSKKEVAESFIKNYFPQDLLELFDTDDLEISKDSFDNREAFILCYLLRQHFLYFLPLPQGQGSLRPTLFLLTI